MNVLPTSPLGVVGDALLVASLAAILGLEVRRRRRLARARRERAAALQLLGKAYAGPLRRRTDQRGQALVEMALVLPFALFTALGFVEAGFLLAGKAEQDREVATLASWVAANPERDPEPIVHRVHLEACDLRIQLVPGLALWEVRATCHYQPRVTAGLWEGLPISSEAAAAALPEPEPSPSPEPSSPGPSAEEVPA